MLYFGSANTSVRVNIGSWQQDVMQTRNRHVATIAKIVIHKNGVWKVGLHNSAHSAVLREIEWQARYKARVEVNLLSLPANFQ